MQHAWTSGHFRGALRAEGGVPAPGETGFEVTFSDNLTEWLAIQPDLQWICNPGGTLTAHDAVVATLRLKASF